MHFEDFIDDMEEEDYESYINDPETSQRHKEIAMKIREQVPENDGNEPPTQQQKEREYRKFIAGFKRFFS